MRNYEALLLFDPSMNDEAIKNGLNEFGDLVKKRGGAIDQTIERGKKKLGYEIKGKSSAYTYCVLFKVDPAKVRDIEYDLKLVSNIMRTNIFSLDENKRFPGNLTATMVGAEQQQGNANNEDEEKEDTTSET